MKYNCMIRCGLKTKMFLCDEDDELRTILGNDNYSLFKAGLISGYISKLWFISAAN